MSNTLCHYLKRNHDQGIIDFCLRARVERNAVSFYIRPADRDGETCDYFVIGNLTINASVNDVIADFATALKADCAKFGPMPDSSCPKCMTVQHGTYLEYPWFAAFDGGREPNTVNGPGEYWASGIQTCFECGHQWEAGG
jgi:hypothetical protein